MHEQELQELSFRNLVEYYREELTKIQNGAKPREVFTEYRYLSFIHAGVLERPPGQHYTQLTQKAKTQLGI